MERQYISALKLAIQLLPVLQIRNRSGQIHLYFLFPDSNCVNGVYRTQIVMSIDYKKNIKRNFDIPISGNI